MEPIINQHFLLSSLLIRRRRRSITTCLTRLPSGCDTKLTSRGCNESNVGIVENGVLVKHESPGADARPPQAPSNENH